MVIALVSVLAVVAHPAPAQTYSEVTGSPYGVGDFPEDVVVTRGGALLFVFNAGDDTVSAFQTDGPDLTPVAGSPFTLDEDAVSIAADDDYLYVANSGLSDSIGVYAIAGAGSLSEVTGSPFACGGNAPQHLAVTPNQAFLVVTNAASSDFGVFAINRSTGALSPVAGSPFTTDAEPQGIAIDPTSTRLVIGNCVGDSISVFDLDPVTGVPTEIPASPFSHSDCPLELEFSPSGSYLYVYALNSFNGYEVAPDGTLVELSNSPYSPSGFTNFQGVSVAADGTKVFSTGWDYLTDDSFLVVLDVVAGGDLVPAPYSPVPLRRNSWYLRAHSADDLVYLTNALDDSLSVMTPVVMSGRGEATIDGVATPGEWSSAATRPFQVELADGSVAEATLAVMAGETDLYLAVSVQKASLPGTTTVAFEFDNDADGACSDGNDAVAFTTTFLDSFRVGGCLSLLADAVDGGTNDGAGASDGLGTFFELSHPLASGDAGHDLDIGLGDTIGFYLEITNCTSTCVTTVFPQDGSSSYYGHIRISGPLFADGFESGSTTMWSFTTP